MRKQPLKHYLLHMAVTVISLGLIAVTAVMFIMTQSIKVPPEGLVYEYKPGTSLKSLATNLQQQGVIKHPHVFELYARVLGKDKTMRAGEYFFASGSSSRNIITQISKGEVMLHPFKIIEGWNIYDLQRALQAKDNIAQTIDFSDEDWLVFITTDYKHPEGLFMPDTYFYTKGESDQAILKRAYNDMQRYLQTAWESKSEEVEYKDPYQVLIVASIVEKETSILDEQPEIAGVLVRRLQKNMRLQMDPTVIYGMCPNFNGNITKADLQKDTPYNTYVHRGLPPTPIAMPSRRAINAALHPNEGESLYFVAKGDGSHYFSDTLEEHNEAVVKYILRGNKQELEPDEQS